MTAPTFERRQINERSRGTVCNNAGRAMGRWTIISVGAKLPGLVDILIKNQTPHDISDLEKLGEWKWRQMKGYVESKEKLF